MNTVRRLCAFGISVMVSTEGAFSASDGIRSTRVYGPAGPTFLIAAKNLQHRAPVLLEPKGGVTSNSLAVGPTPDFKEESELPVLLRASLAGGETVIVCPPLPAGRYVIGLRGKSGDFGARDVVQLEVFSEDREAEWAKWTEGWGLFFRVQHRRGEEAAVYAIGRALLGDRLVKFNQGMDASSGRLRNERWIKAELADALDRGEWAKVAKLALAFSVLAEPPWNVKAEIVRNMPPAEVHQLVGEAEKLARGLFGHLPRLPELRRIIDDVDLGGHVERWYRWHIDPRCLSRNDWPGDIALRAAVSGLDFPDWAKASDGSLISDCAVKFLRRFLGFKLDISGMPMVERTRFRRKLDVWLKNCRRGVEVPDEQSEEGVGHRLRLIWDDGQSMFLVWNEEEQAYVRPEMPALFQQDVAPQGGWWPGFAFGIGAGAAFAVLCYLAERLVRRALARRK